MLKFFSFVILASVIFNSSNGLAEHVPNQLIVKFKDQANHFTQQNVLQSMGAQILQRFQTNDAVLIQLPRRKNDLKKIINALKAYPEVQYAEPNSILHARAQAKTLPNDPYYSDLYALRKNRNRSADIFTQEAWTKITGSSQVLVAVIDSGIDYNHEDLADNYWHNPGESGLDFAGKDKKNNGVDDDHNGMVDDWGGWNFVENNNDPMDDSEHGTHCAGTIGAVGNNGIGVVGVNWQVSLVGLKFLDKTGSGSLADAVAAIEYATKIGVHVMNNSWGGDEYSETMAAAIRKARDAGILFVVAAGNNSSDNDVSLDYPSSYNIENIISVTATDSEGELAGFSNFGAHTVHIAAPGVKILSTLPGGKYGELDGTSMAAPHVAGAAALIKARYPLLKAREIKARLLGWAVPTSQLKGKVIAGLLNINNALEDDHSSPTAANNLTVLESGSSSLLLEWSPSSDLGKQSAAFGYEIRRSSKQINSEADWNLALALPLVLEKQNSAKVRGHVEDLPLNSTGYLTIRAFDRSGNLSAFSQSIPYTVKAVKTLYENKKNAMDDLTIEGPWGQEQIAGHGSVISDSPGEVYGYGKTSILQLPKITLHSTDAVLSFQSKFEFEVGYDFGFVEVSTDDGDNWQKVTQFNGAQDWSSYSLSLKSFIAKGETSLLIRFRVTGDATHSMDGWYLSQISVFN